MVSPTAKVRMKAMVVARLLMGEFETWEHFEQERERAGEIVNRRIARSVSSQIGRTYRDLSKETKKFISENFEQCDYDDFARLCDEIQTNRGLYMRLDEYSKTFFPLSKHIRDRFPFHAHVAISLYGLRFEFPEHHFLKDLDVSFDQLADVRSRLAKLLPDQVAHKGRRSDVADLVSRDKFLSRSIISASFSLVEAFLSGIFYTAIQTGSFGQITCSEEFLSFAGKNESAALKKRLDQTVEFASKGKETGDGKPFKDLIRFGKRYRDAIHHTTPFGRKDIEKGGRLTALYEIKGDVALRIALLSFDVVLKISGWAYGASDPTAIAADCESLRGKALELLGGDSGSVKV